MMITQPNRMNRQLLVMAPRKILCFRLGLVIFVNSATTASLGMLNEKIPGTKPENVNRMAPDFSSSVSVEK